jgi:hypothetical protein
MVMLERPMGIKISPGGRRAAVAVRTTNWRENRYETVCRVHDLVEGTHYPVNRTGSVSQFEWVDDGTLAVLIEADGEDAKAQIVLYEGLTGDGWVITDQETGVDWFAPFAGGFVYRARHPERDERKARADRFGKFVHMEQEESPSALYYVDLEALRDYETRVKAATEDEAKKLVRPVVELSLLLAERLAIRDVFPSPTGDAVYFTTWKREDLVFHRQTRAYCIRLHPRAAVVEHIRREYADAEEGSEKPPKDEKLVDKDWSYVGRIDRLQIPRAAALAGVAPDGAGWLFCTRAATTGSTPSMICG